MQQNIDNIQYLLGTPEVLHAMKNISVLRPFDLSVRAFLNDVSKAILSDSEARSYSDVMTFAFWIRKGNVENLRKRFMKEDKNIIRMGRGVLFHIAPSNVAVNYGYSMVAGLLAGNANVVRMSSTEFPQIQIINRNIKVMLEKHKNIKQYICLIRYGYEKEINDYLSWLADIRVIWGGDNTIAEIRKSPLRPRASEITFADRFSIAVVDAKTYLNSCDSRKVALDFYNDTYLTDQNACTSPRAVVWIYTGDDGKGQKIISEAKTIFWKELHKLVKEKYENYSPIKMVDKLTNSFLLAAEYNGKVKKEIMPDNLIVRLQVHILKSEIMNWKDNSGYFFEFECNNILDMLPLCNDECCQTLSYIGNVDLIRPLIDKGIRGVDRIIPIGKTMDFDLIWDGYNLIDRLTRVVYEGTAK